MCVHPPSMHLSSKGTMSEMMLEPWVVTRVFISVFLPFLLPLLKFKSLLPWAVQAVHMKFKV